MLRAVDSWHALALRHGWSMQREYGRCRRCYGAGATCHKLYPHSLTNWYLCQECAYDLGGRIRIGQAVALIAAWKRELERPVDDGERPY